MFSSWKPIKVGVQLALRAVVSSFDHFPRNGQQYLAKELLYPNIVRVTTTSAKRKTLTPPQKKNFTKRFGLGEVVEMASPEDINPFPVTVPDWGSSVGVHWWDMISMELTGGGMLPSVCTHSFSCRPEGLVQLCISLGFPLPRGERKTK